MSWESLKEVTNAPGYRWVGSTMMDRVQFLAEGWHLHAGAWRASLSGLQSYGASQHAKREAFFAQKMADRYRRDEEDESFRELYPEIRALEGGQP